METLEQKPLEMQRAGERKRVAALWLAINGLLIVALLVILVVITSLKQEALDSLLVYEQNLQKEVALLDQLLAQKTVFEQTGKNLDKQTAKVQRCTMCRRNAPDLYLKELADILPRQIVLKTFLYSPKAMKIKGIAANMRYIRQFMYVLSKSKCFKNPQLVSVYTKSEKHGVGKYFEITVLKA